MNVTRYVIARYVPDAVREEQMNIGVIVATDDGTFWDSRFRTDWRRLRSFAKRDISFLKDVVRDLEAATDLQSRFDDSSPFDTARLQQLSQNWKNAIQFSDVRTSIAEPRTLLDRLYRQMVSDATPANRRARDKRVVLKQASEALRSAVEQRFHGHAHRPEVLPRQTISGKLDLHPTDLVVQNGRLLVAADAISFEPPPSTDLENEARAIAWSLQDIRSAHPEMSLNVLVLPPRTSRKDYDRHRTVYRELEVRVVEASEITTWAAETVERLPVSTG